MSLSTFSRSRAAMQTIEEVAALIEDACKKASVAMADIPEPLRSQGLAELVESVQKWLLPFKATGPLAVVPVVPVVAVQGEESPQVDDRNLPPPTEALLKVLRDNPNGLTLRQVVSGLDGKFSTTSPEPQNVLYTAIKRLRLKKVIVERRGLLSLAPEQRTLEVRAEQPTGQFTTGTTLHRVRDFFTANGNTPATVEAISVATDVPEASLRHLFNTRYPHHFVSEKIHGNLNLWRAKPEAIASDNEGG